MGRSADRLPVTSKVVARVGLSRKDRLAVDYESGKVKAEEGARPALMAKHVGCPSLY